MHWADKVHKLVRWKLLIRRGYKILPLKTKNSEEGFKSMLSNYIESKIMNENWQLCQWKSKGSTKFLLWNFKKLKACQTLSESVNLKILYWGPNFHSRVNLEL